MIDNRGGKMEWQTRINRKERLQLKSIPKPIGRE